MRGSIAQVAALTIFGNDALLGRPRKSFWPDSSVFQFCNSVTFLAADGLLDAIATRRIATDPARWIDGLAKAQAVRLRLHHVARNDPRVSDRMSEVWVGGGGRWVIEAMREWDSDVWESEWRIGNEPGPAGRPWRVEYRRLERRRAHLPFRPRGLPEICIDLEAALTAIESFAIGQDLKVFAGSFRVALNALSAEDPAPTEGYPDLVLSSGAPLEARRLLIAVQRAWVFGGMGSWNDHVFEGTQNQQYETLTDRLYALLIEAICGAVNSSSDA